MTQDRLKTAFTDCVRGAQSDVGAEFDPRALYPAEVVAWNANGTVDVRFDDRDLGTKSGVLLAPGVGVTRYQVTQGTRILVGWRGHDLSQQPYAAALWLRSGGLVDFTQEFSGTYKVDGPKVELCGGGRGVARLNDTVGAQQALLTWMSQVELAVNILAGGPVVNPLSTTFAATALAKIVSASAKVEADT